MCEYEQQDKLYNSTLLLSTPPSVTLYIHPFPPTPTSLRFPFTPPTLSLSIPCPSSSVISSFVFGLGGLRYAYFSGGGDSGGGQRGRESSSAPPPPITTLDTSSMLADDERSKDVSEPSSGNG